jgi:hypothetical protein
VVATATSSIVSGSSFTIGIGTGTERERERIEGRDHGGAP